MDYVLLHEICSNFVSECSTASLKDPNQIRAFERAASKKLSELKNLAADQCAARKKEKVPAR